MHFAVDDHLFFWGNFSCCGYDTLWGLNSFCSLLHFDGSVLEQTDLYHSNVMFLCSVRLFTLSCAGVTVCMMSVLGVKPGETGDGVILSRLEKDSAPVTIHISTSKQQVRGGTVKAPSSPSFLCILLPDFLFKCGDYGGFLAVFFFSTHIQSSCTTRAVSEELVFLSLKTDL